MKFKHLILLFILLISIVLVFVLLPKEKKETQEETTKRILTELNAAVNIMVPLGNRFDGELAKVHNYLVEQFSNKKIKLVAADPKLGDLVMYHGAVSGSIYVNTRISLKPELWIPVLYHEVAHRYWRSQRSDKTIEELQASLFDSESYAYSINARAWDFVRDRVDERELKTELEQRLFKLYTAETNVYNAKLEGNSEAEAKWHEIIEEDIRVQNNKQKLINR